MYNYFSLPLVQSRQNFNSMDLQLRQEFQGSIEKLSEKYGLADIIYATFVLTYGYRNKYCAADVVYGILAILECAVSYFTPPQIYTRYLNKSRKAELGKPHY